MIPARILSSFIAGSGLIVTLSGTASAITLPDSGTCGAGFCLNITNSSTSSTNAIVGNDSFGTGVLGTTVSGTGVKGTANASSSGSAVLGDAGGSFTAWAGNFNGDVAGRDFFGNSFNPSDVRLKENIKDATYGLKDVLSLRPVTYQWKDPTKHGEGVQVGLIAQEVQKLIPELVKGRGRDNELALNYNGLIPVLIKAVQEQQAEINALHAERKASTLSSRGSLGVGAVVAFGFLPFGVVAMRRLRRRRED
jgi:Chaperone of endosialidase